MTKFPVLDDNTSSSEVIGFASTPEEAVQVYRANWTSHADDADSQIDELGLPSFAFRHPDSLSPGIRSTCPDGAFEPLF